MEQIVIEFLQSIRSPFWDGFFYMITMLADKWSFLLLFCIIYWCIDKKLGYLVGVTLLSTSSVNSLVKEYVKAPRPFETLNINAFGRETASGYSFPSGHTQTSASFFTLLSLKTSKMMIGIGILFTVLIALSRLYLGVHWPKDVIYGIAAGMLVAGGLFIIDKFAGELFTGIIILGFTAAFLFLPIPKNSDFTNSLYTMVGITAGKIFETFFVGFGPARTIVAGIGRILFGLIVTSASFISIYYFFPSYPFLYFTISSFVATGLIPLAFEKEMKKYY